MPTLSGNATTPPPPPPQCRRWGFWWNHELKEGRGEVKGSSKRRTMCDVPLYFLVPGFLKGRRRVATGETGGVLIARTWRLITSPSVSRYCVDKKGASFESLMRGENEKKQGPSRTIGRGLSSGGYRTNSSASCNVPFPSSLSSRADVAIFAACLLGCCCRGEDSSAPARGFPLPAAAGG